MKYHPILLTAVLWITNPSLLVSAQDGTVPPVDPLASPSEPELPPVSADADKAEPEADKLTAENLIITRSADRTEVRGFSATKGTWENLALPKSDTFEWFAQGDIATVRAADTLAAFSAETGHWDVLKLSKDSKAVCVTNGPIATIEDGGHFYTFSAKTSSWTSPTDTRLAVGEMLLPSMELSPDTRAAFQAWSDSQPRHKTFSITQAVGGLRLDASRKEYLDEALYMLNKLIAEQAAGTASEPDPFAGGSTNAAPSNGDPNSILNRSPSPDELQRQGMRINSLKRDAVHREGMLKSFARGRDLSKPEVMTELREATAVAFDKRQEWYEAEAKRLEMRLQQIQSEIAQRKSTREDIIERQLHQLRKLQRATTSSSDPFASDGDIPPTPANDPASTTNASTSPTVPASTVSASPTESARALRQAKTLVDKLTADRDRAVTFIAKYSKPLDVLKKEGVVPPEQTQDSVDKRRRQTENSLTSTKEQLLVAQKDWQLLWEEYQSQVRILASELETLKLQRERAKEELVDLHQAFGQGLIPNSEFQRADAFAKIIEQGLVRGEERLKLFSLVKEQQPELEPPSTQTTTPTPAPENVKPDDPFAR